MAIGTLKIAAARPGTNNGVTEYAYTHSCSSCGEHTSGIKADRQGLIWLDDSLQDNFGSFPIGGGSFSFYEADGHPHDGLYVDTQNRIWFSEEFAFAVPSTGTPTLVAITSRNASGSQGKATNSIATPFPVPGSPEGNHCISDTRRCCVKTDPVVSP